MRSIISKALFLILFAQSSWAIVYNINDDDYITNVSSPSFKYSVIYSTMTPPGIPAAGKGYTYLDTDKKIKFINSDGTIYDLTTGAGGTDNLGNHIATTTLIMGGFDITGAGAISATSVTSTCTYATNSGQLQGHAASYFATSAGLSSYTPLSLTINEISALATTYLGISAKAADSDKLDNNDSAYFATATGLSSEIATRINEISSLTTSYLSSDYISANGTFIRFDPANDGDIQAEISESSMTLNVPLHTGHVTIGDGNYLYLMNADKLYMGAGAGNYIKRGESINQIDFYNNDTRTAQMTSSSFTVNVPLYIPQDIYNTGTFYHYGSVYIGDGTRTYGRFFNRPTDGLHFGLGSDSGYGNRNLILIDRANFNDAYGHAQSANPTLFLHSTTAATTRKGEWASLSTGTEDFTIATGTNTLNIVIDIEGNGTAEVEVTKTSMTVNVPLYLGSNDLNIAEGKLADSVIVSADIKDSTIVAGDMTAATTGWFVNWNNMSNVPAGFADGTDDTGGGGAAALMVSVDEVEKSSPTIAISFENVFTGLKSGNTTFIYISTAAVANGDTAHIPNGDQVYDWGIATFQPTVTEGSLADSVVVSADIKDATITTADLSAAASGYLTSWGNVTDKAIVTGEITDGTIALGDLAAATTGWLTDWNNLSNVPAGFADGTDDEGAGGGDNLGNHIATTTLVMGGNIISGMNSLTLGADDTTAGLLTIYGDNAKESGRIKLYNSVDYDDTEEYWMLKASSTWVSLCAEEVETFKFYSAGNLTAAGNIAGATYGSDASVSNAELLYINTLASNAQTQINGKQATVTEGSLADSVIISADIKDATIALADLAAATTGWLTAWANLTEVPDYEEEVTEGSLADSTIISADIKDGEIVVGDMSAATTGYLTNWANVSNKAIVTGEITDGTIALADLAAATSGFFQNYTNIKEVSVTTAQLAAATSGYLTNWANIKEKAIVTGEITDGTIALADLAAATSSYLTNWNSLSNKPSNVEDFSVCISTPNLLTATEGYQISPFYGYAVTYSTMSAICNDGATFVCMIEQRVVTAPNSAGTDIWSGDVTVPATEWRGGGVSDFTVPANYALFLVPTSWTGNVTSLMIRGKRTRD